MTGSALLQPARRRAVFARRLLAALTVVASLASGCGMPPPPRGFGQGGYGQGGNGSGPGHRPQQLGLSPAQELQVGREAYEKVLREYQNQLVPNDSEEAVRVRRILGKLVATLQIRPLLQEMNLRYDPRAFDWQVHLVRSNKVNAFCLPGGFMIVYTGLLQVAQDDDQVATVLGHEMAHALAHHASERVARQQREGRGPLGILRGLSFDREQEAEADHIGLFLMAFAGYDPREAVRFWVRMHQLSGSRGQVPEILSDHPSDERRIENMERWAARVIAGKQAYDEGRIAPAAAAHRGAAGGAASRAGWPAIVLSLTRGNEP